MATRKKKVDNGDDCVITKGTHLTVATYKDGSTILTWDDEQLLKEVREAIAGVKKPNVKAKVEVQKKKQKAKSEILNSVEQSMKAIEKAKERFLSNT